MKTLIIRFNAEIEKASIDKLLKILDKKMRKYEKVRLLISSKGGSITEGLTAYHYLKNLPTKVETHNIGSVDSIAVVLFCAGQKRFAVSQASFLVHSVVFNPTQEEYEEKKVVEKLKNLIEQRKNIAAVVAETCRTKAKDIEEMMMKGITLNPSEAKKLGLVDEISDDLFSEKDDIVAIT